MFVIVEIQGADGDRRTAFGRSTPVERQSMTLAMPVWYEAANRAAARALRGCGVNGRGFAALTTPQVIDRAGGAWQATAVDSAGAVMGRASITVRPHALRRSRV